MDDTHIPGTRVRIKHSGESGVVAKWPAPVEDRIRVRLDTGRSFVCRPDEVEQDLADDASPEQAQA
jgi:hypothetical protein